MQENKQPNVASLGRAIKQLEALLEARAKDGGTEKPESPAEHDLPVLDDIIDPRTGGADELTDFESVTPTEALAPQANAEQIREALQRLSEQMEIELEALVGMLKESMLYEFRQELASALGIDPEQLETFDKDDNAADT